MPEEFRHPGVYVEELPSGAHSIPGVPTSNPGVLIEEVPSGEHSIPGVPTAIPGVPMAIPGLPATVPRRKRPKQSQP